MNTQPDLIWLIAYIDTSKVPLLVKDLNKSNQFSEIEAYVPTVKVLKKQFKGKDIFDEVPLLFNYGFFKVPRVWAINVDLLAKLKADITCIAHFVKDPAKPQSEVKCATATQSDIENIIMAAKANNIYSAHDIDNLKIGSLVNLVGYPFEGMEATVVHVNKQSKKIRVTLDLGFEGGENGKEVEVSFDNVFYTIYKGSHDENYNQERLLEDYQSVKYSKNHAEQ